MRLALCSCNPACQERRSITHASLPTAVPLSFVTAGCKPAQRECHTKSTNLRAALTMWKPSDFSGNMAPFVVEVGCLFPRLRASLRTKKAPRECSESSTSRENCKNLRRSEKPRMFSPVNSRIPELLLFSTAPTYELLLLAMLLTWWSHDDMMLITWWSDEKTAPGHSWHSSVPRKFSNSTSFEKWPYKYPLVI